MKYCHFCNHEKRDHKNSSGTLYCVGGGCMPCSCDTFVEKYVEPTPIEDILARVAEIEKTIEHCDETCAKIEKTLDKILEELRGGS